MPEEEIQDVQEVEQTETVAEPETAETQQEPKHGSRFQERISQLTRTKYRLQDELEELRAENERLRSKSPTTTETAPISDAPTRPKPLSSDPKYKTYEEFTEDLASWSTEQVLAKQRQVDAQRAQNERLQENFESYNEQIEAAREKYEDWDEIAAARPLRIPKIAELALVEMDNGAEVVYYLAKHPEVREELLELNERSELRVVQELGRIADRLNQTESPVAETEEEETAEVLPPPLKPVGGNTTRGVSKDPSKMTVREYEQWRLKNKRH